MDIVCLVSVQLQTEVIYMPQAKQESERVLANISKSILTDGSRRTNGM